MKPSVPSIGLCALLLFASCARVSNQGASTKNSDLDAFSPDLNAFSPSPFPTDAHCPQLARIDDDVLVIWQQELASGRREIFARRLDATGRPTAAAVQISFRDHEDGPSCPKVIAHADSFDVFWTIYSRIYHSRLSRLGEVTQAPHYHVVGADPSISADERVYGVAFRGSDSRIHFWRFDAEFEPIGDPALIETADEVVVNPIVCASEGGWIVAWRTAWSAAPWKVVRLSSAGAVEKGPLRLLDEEFHEIKLSCHDGHLSIVAESVKIERIRWLQVAVSDAMSLETTVGPVKIWMARDESVTPSITYASGRFLAAFEAEVSAGPIYLSAFAFTPEVGLGFDDGGLGAPGDGGVSTARFDSGAPKGLTITQLGNGRHPVLLAWDDGRCLIAFTRKLEGFTRLLLQQHRL